MKITYREAVRDDVTRQFRYYLVTLGLPEVALRFRGAVKAPGKLISKQPSICPRYFVENSQLQNLRSWPVAGFEAIRFYFILENNGVRVIRILHGKRDIRAILERENP